MSKSNLWVERYRPKTIDDYVFTDETVREQVQHWIKTQSIPHLLLHGSAGTGKTTLSKILISALNVDSIDVMYTNGSKEGRKIEWVDRLIGFAQTMPFGPLKIVLIDEADYLNPASVQPAMRNLMEDYADTTRFIMTCNYPNRIIPALKSRCHEIVINKTDPVEFTARAARVLLEESVDFDIDVLDNFVKATYPDLRKCLNLLQANSSSGKLVKPDLSSVETSDYRLAAIDLIKVRKHRAARQLICDQVSTADVEDVFRWMYNNLELWSDNAEGQDQAILIIRNGLVNHAVCADAEINLSATLVELSAIN